ncbi:tRNA pseudouridine synthase D [Pyricularia oryzae]|uniref:TRUD domain-containing protein n=3 Tax=Pyricularia oryzae TaxID=318829 RepID=A0A4P7NH70_PYROR|nr:tRNA pseudouridine synthase D [Pyricularia oryzae Y34]KAI7925344.1 tRNA pseudouridine synthase D [Pyricularia oryzae]KAI7925962.1 tRNA pseudouridine synthase D [Pyricularia oryzae]QBZ61322.1 hypothetical protein PoMZ_08271 [Pyricularia oryzae]
MAHQSEPASTPIAKADNQLHHQVLTASHIASARNASEKRLGILHFASPIDYGWNGDIRKRYTDFQVFEVRKDGSVIHLSDFQQAARRPPQSRPEADAASKSSHPNGNLNELPVAKGKPSPKEAPAVVEATYHPISDEDTALLCELLGNDATEQVIDLDKKVQAKDGSSRGVIIKFPSITDRALRTKVHQEARRIFNSRIETQVGEEGVISARAFASQQGQRRNANGPRGSRDGWRGGSRAEPRPPRAQYLHFTLYKENKDTMDAINHIARLLKIKASNFGFAGTKDRRAATVQRVSVWNKDIKELNTLNDKMSGIRVGDFSYQKKPMQLGQHGGNEFVIAIKNVESPRLKDYSITHRLRVTEECVQQALDSIANRGFINYFGLQRFGTHAIGTQEIGMRILREDFVSAVNGILHVDEELSVAVAEGSNDGRFHRDEFDRARAITMWRMSRKSDAALRILPKKYNAENTLIKHLGQAPNDFTGALMHITRGLRMLYIHAYQSFVWNFAASKRWALYGDKIIAGDLVLVQADESPITQRGPVEDMSEEVNQEEEEFYQRARHITEKEVASGRFTIFDVVLPAPGFDVIYPLNEIGQFYVDFMKKEENGRLDPYNMRRKHREYSMSGHYRKLMAKFTATPMFAIRPYVNDEEQMHPTDRDLIEWRKAQESPQQEKTASAWNSFAENAKKFDAATEGEMRRRRSDSPPTETRINDAWVETGFEGGKRMKVSDPIKLEHTQVNKPDFGDQLNAVVKPGEASVSLTGIEQTTAPSVEATQDIEMGNTVPVLDEKGTQPCHGTDENSQRAKAPDLMSFLHKQLESAGSNTLENSAQAPDTDSGASFGSSTNQPATGNNTVSTISAPTQYSSSTTSNEAPKPPLLNVFTNVDKYIDPAHSAVNVSGNFAHTHSCLEGESKEDVKIAVVLKFALSSSSYATICIREMTGQGN